MTLPGFEPDRASTDGTQEINFPSPVRTTVCRHTEGSLARKIANCSLDRLLSWLETAPEVTWDPNDFKAHPWFATRLARRNQWSAKITLRTAYVGFALAPEAMRNLLGVRKVQTAGASAWLAQGYLRAFELTSDSRYLGIAENWLARLRALQIREYDSPVWGFPFDWQSGILIPANTPLSYTIWQAAQSYLEHNLMTGSRVSLQIALDACRGMTKILNRLVDTSEELCLSYSPYDSMEVYNTNALIGGLFIRLATICGDPLLLNDGQRMLNWVARGQQNDGTWEYLSPAFRKNASSIDHFHTAMTLQGLLSGSAVVPTSQKWDTAIERGTRIYLRRFFERDFRPRYSHANAFPVDVMSCAEGILFLKQVQSSRPVVLNPLMSEVQEALEGLVRWTCQSFQERDGCFYFLGYPGFRLRLHCHRWGQGAMLKALTTYLQ